MIRAAVLIGLTAGLAPTAFAQAIDASLGAAGSSAALDSLVEAHWQTAGVEPSGIVGDHEFLRRIALDLTGRIPTPAQAAAFSADTASDKRASAIRDMVGGPEFALHWGDLLNYLIQGDKVEDDEFLTYLRESLAAEKAWDAMFRDLLVGPWDSEQAARADRFLARRVEGLDELTNDASRVFFGVDISCAKCHDHPLVDDWTQDHYYGLASFFNRTYEFDGERRIVGERETGDVEFVDQSGESRTARLMFLRGEPVAEPAANLDPRLADRIEAAQESKQYQPPSYSRREALVQAALAERNFFSRALVNRVWAELFGRGLVHPVEQMHSENPPSIPGVLEFLADDLVANGYSIERLVATIVSSRTYQRSSGWAGESPPPPVEHFAAAQLRPLTPKQYALSLVLAAGDGGFDAAAPADAVRTRHLDLENAARGLTESLDARTDEFQSSVTEALFLSNGPEIQQLLSPAGQNLAARLAAIDDPVQRIELAIWAIYSRPPLADESQLLTEFLSGESAPAGEASARLVWSLVASAEFRFNH